MVLKSVRQKGGEGLGLEGRRQRPLKKKQSEGTWSNKSHTRGNAGLGGTLSKSANYGPYGRDLPKKNLGEGHGKEGVPIT